MKPSLPPAPDGIPDYVPGRLPPMTDWTRLYRFLIFGSEQAHYIARNRVLTASLAPSVLRCLAEDGERAVREIASVSASGRAAREEPLLFSLALAASHGDEATRRSALEALPAVCRTGNQLFRFAHYVDGMRGWGRGLRAAIGRWYSARTVKEVAFQALKYVQGDGWSHRDLLRLAHPKPDGDARRILYHWITQGWERIGDAPHDQKELQLVWAMEKARVPGTTARTVAELVRTYGLPREGVPAGLMGERIVWEALLEKMPLGDLLGNLPTITRIGVLDSRMWLEYVSSRLTDERQLTESRLHPIAILAAAESYIRGHNDRGNQSWTPARKIGDALDAAFYSSFETVESTGKRILLSLDVSGSMDNGTAGGITGLSPRVASAAMALITANADTSAEMLAFQPSLARFASPLGRRLGELVKTLRNLPYGATDCAQPMLWAMQNKVQVDAFLVLTDSETGFGPVHPADALRKYREATGIPARLIVIGMTADHFSIADPDDAGMLDVIGFDMVAPRLIFDLVKG